MHKKEHKKSKQVFNVTDLSIYFLPWISRRSLERRFGLALKMSDISQVSESLTTPKHIFKNKINLFTHSPIRPGLRDRLRPPDALQLSSTKLSKVNSSDLGPILFEKSEMAQSRNVKSSDEEDCFQTK